MLEDLLTEQPNPASVGIDVLPTEGILHVIHAEDSRVPAAINCEIKQIARAVDAVVEAIRNGGRLFYLGAGTSGRLGVLDAAECPPTFGVSPDLVQAIIAGGENALAQAGEASEDDPEQGARDLFARGFGGKDVLVGIAASGRTPYVLGAVRAAREMGAMTACICCSPGSPLAGAVNIPIVLLTGPEVIAGSTRMKAGTATKLVLNMISTATMIRLGLVYGNLMVNVQPKNAKLADRARRIIAQTAQVSLERAAQLLEESGGDVRVAILLERLGVRREEAGERLRKAGGRLSEALAQSGMGDR